MSRSISLEKQKDSITAGWSGRRLRKGGMRAVDNVLGSDTNMDHEIITNHKESALKTVKSTTKRKKSLL